ncbi:terpenoid cyclases/protein prenyltransferase alpha-alpha toroid [Pelagophyceae sp. CCMP2097]|nr:terpenoid cyclases/protein prenyltransferase alpha-alpha toroid [Pelagophyceae sp. CCMP2097]|mmetsp:Transcript_7447/g.26048  ORF Transcript_7447/g.26048 Transcript_7447/m.26048 type:complete len:189 (-) Transcript_7447:72-638(-)
MKVYCACAIAALLADFTGFDAEKAARHVGDCQAYDGGLALEPEREAHGGATYCGCAAHELLRKHAGAPATLDVGAVVGWCSRRQEGGFSGRVGKPPDACYAFWVGASLRMLGAAESVDSDEAAAFVMSCESVHTGGFSKFPDGSAADLLHSFYSVCALSWASPGVLRPVDPLLGICESRLPHRLKGPP